MKKNYGEPPLPPKTTPDLDIHQVDEEKWSVSVGGREIGTRSTFTECLELYEGYMAENGYFER